jgi:hypothetical protein
MQKLTDSVASFLEALTVRIEQKPPRDPIITRYDIEAQKIKANTFTLNGPPASEGYIVDIAPRPGAPAHVYLVKIGSLIAFEATAERTIPVVRIGPIDPGSLVHIETHGNPDTIFVTIENTRHR